MVVVNDNAGPYKPVKRKMAQPIQGMHGHPITAADNDLRDLADGNNDAIRRLASARAYDVVQISIG
jgi:hypothetical protein